jgi:hypothetical protein
MKASVLYEQFLYHRYVRLYIYGLHQMFLSWVWSRCPVSSVLVGRPTGMYLLFYLDIPGIYFILIVWVIMIYLKVEYLYMFINLGTIGG